MFFCLVLLLVASAAASKVRLYPCVCDCGTGNATMKVNVESTFGGCTRCQETCTAAPACANATVISSKCTVDFAKTPTCLRSDPKKMSAVLACAKKSVPACDQAALELVVTDAKPLGADQCACLHAIGGCVLQEQVCPKIEIGNGPNSGIETDDYERCLNVCGAPANTSMSGICGELSASSLVLSAAVFAVALAATFA